MSRMSVWVEKHKKVCPSCGSYMYYRSKRCKNCTGNQEKSTAIRGMTIGEYRNRASVSGKHPSWVHAEIRNFARSWNKSLQTSECRVCGYKIHVELCHIKPLSSFPDSALLGEVNDPANIVPLCRNCHWEFDNGLITL